MIDITEIVLALIGLLTTIITVVVVPYVKSKSNENKFKTNVMWVTIAVEAAEQIYRESGMGQVKKQYVIDFLKSKGITVDDEAIDVMIESAVLQLKNSLVVE